MFSDDACITGLEQFRGGLSRRDSRVETVFGVLLPLVLLLVEGEPGAGVPGTADWSFPLIPTVDIVVFLRLTYVGVPQMDDASDDKSMFSFSLSRPLPDVHA